MQDQIMSLNAEITSKKLKKENFVKYLKDKSDTIQNGKEVGIVNPNGSSSILIKDNNEISISTDKLSKIKVNRDKILTVSNEVHTKTNRVLIDTEEVLINNHKLNPQLIELSDTRILFDDTNEVIGNLTLNGTVLVKAWEPNLNKYVLIRRKIRTPIFSYNLNQPVIPEQFDLSSGVAYSIDLESALDLLKAERERQKVTAEEHFAEGGSNYDQGDYNNYEDGGDEVFNSGTLTGTGTSISQDGGYMTEVIVTKPGAYVWPVPESSRITSDYGTRYYKGEKQFHNGIDIGQGPLGEKTKIIAIADGVVKTAWHTEAPKGSGYGGYGLCVDIEHPDGMKSLYGHMCKVYVSKGQEVKQGQVIGLMGQTGVSSGVHLHLSIAKVGDAFSPGLNPNEYVKPQN